jgi:hypothetical protein
MLRSKRSLNTSSMAICLGHPGTCQFHILHLHTYTVCQRQALEARHSTRVTVPTQTDAILVINSLHALRLGH